VLAAGVPLFLLSCRAFCVGLVTLFALALHRHITLQPSKHF